MGALISYHFKIPYPEELDDQTFWHKWEQLKWVLFFENKRANAKEGENVEL
ncbi:hypothetical protein KB553_09025 [Chryseobacterium rhizoplanae]|uniref:hypothetical protein n=1 Tax=Chryseobacterium rhizoplanae TaxID=1609531 RepID=UPI001CE24C94|nr:hypothetical protein [Chryseobacterium rhizoplanae]UCA61663.1 hypothetical protein KB553_09025 [Chryseobacterium rhizoplanae]